MNHTHFSDLVRLQLLTEYGGIWTDATLFCTGRRFDKFLNMPLFVYRENVIAGVAASWFIVSDAHDPIITLTRDLLFDYWQKYNYVIHYFVFDMFFKMASRAYKNEFEKIPFFSDQIPHEMQYSMYEEYSEEKMKHFESISDFHKMTYKIKPDNMPSSNSIYQHIINMY